MFALFLVFQLYGRLYFIARMLLFCMFLGVSMQLKDKKIEGIMQS